MKSKFSTSFLVFLYIFIDLIFMENVSINSSEIFFVQFTYHLNMNEQKRPIKTTKIIFPHCFLSCIASAADCSIACHGLVSWCGITCSISSSKREAL